MDEPHLTQHHDDEALAQIAKALSHPARLALVRSLFAKPSCCGYLVQDLADKQLALAQSTVSQHLRVLVEAGLVTRTLCGVESYYNLNQEALTASLAMLGALGAPVAQSTKKEA